MARLTFIDLVTAASSTNAEHRRQAFEAFQAWVRVAPRLQPDQRLNQCERDTLKKLFAEKGLAQATERKSRG